MGNAHEACLARGGKRSGVAEIILVFLSLLQFRRALLGVEHHLVTFGVGFHHLRAALQDLDVFPGDFAVLGTYLFGLFLHLLGLLFLFAAVANAGLPPLSGFIGKLAILEGVIGTDVVPWLWGAMLLGGLLATVALARAGARLFWKVSPQPGSVTRVLPLEAAAIAALAACTLALVAFAAPAQRYASAAAAQVRNPQDYVRAVLGAAPVPSPQARSAHEGAPR